MSSSRQLDDYVPVEGDARSSKAGFVNGEALTCAIDRLGRIVIPVELRRQVGLYGGDEVNVALADHGLVVRKIKPTCVLCDRDDSLTPIRDKHLCRRCVHEITNATV